MVHFFDFNCVHPQFIISSLFPLRSSMAWKVLYAISSPFYSSFRFQSVSLLANALYVVWVIQRLLLLCSDVELNPGPETL